jgi:hypothetical protein
MFGLTVTPSYCPWTLKTIASWLSLPVMSGVGSGNPMLSLSANPAAVARTATISSANGGASFAITQNANACTSELVSPASTVGAAGGFLSAPLKFSGSGCDATASSNVPWTATSVAGSYVGLSVGTNTFATPRAGTVTLSGKTFTINQAPGSGCAFEVETIAFTADVNGAITPKDFNVTASAPGCEWSAFTGVRWAAFNPGGGKGSGKVTLAVLPNFSTKTRMVSANIAGQTVTITQPGSIEPEDARFVRLIYFSAFARPASQGEVTSQVSNLATLGRNAFARGARFRGI